MESVAEQANALLLAVEDEVCIPQSRRPTLATDQDLNEVAAVLAAIARPHRPHGGSAVAGVISRTVTDRWSLTADLSERLVEFDRRLRLPPRSADGARSFSETGLGRDIVR